MKSRTGFTLIELIIVIVIVGILTVVSIPIYRGYTQRAKISEGKTLAASIITAQRVYYSERGTWYDVAGWIQENTILAVDARQNRYFTKVTTGPSDKYGNVICAAARSESEDMIIYQFWPKKMDEPSNYPKWLITDLLGNVIAEEW
jgi:prepilin-type N-terminal cleavage/methylation domain-containing protein